MSDPVEQARNIQLLQFREWTDVLDGQLFVTCHECGSSHAYLFRITGPGMLRVRVDFDDALTQATREYNDHPLYKEVLALREENMQLKRRIKGALKFVDATNSPHVHKILTGEE